MFNRRWPWNCYSKMWGGPCHFSKYLKKLGDTDDQVDFQLGQCQEVINRGCPYLWGPSIPRSLQHLLGRESLYTVYWVPNSVYVLIMWWKSAQLFAFSWQGRICEWVLSCHPSNCRSWWRRLHINNRYIYVDCKCSWWSFEK